MAKIVSSLRVLLPGSLLWGQETFLLSLLVDLGNDEVFLDASVMQQAKVPLVRLPEPKTILDLDGEHLRRSPTTQHR